MSSFELESLDENEKTISGSKKAHKCIIE